MTPFVNCPSLTEITCLATMPPTLNATAFLSMTQGDITLYVPEEAVETYKATPMWKNFNVQPVSATGISTTLNEPVKRTNDSWYTIDGRPLDGKSNAKGLYIHNGRKIVIK